MTRRVDVPLLLIAVVVATFGSLWLGSRVAVARCREAGGQIRVSGMDQTCERTDGTPLVTAPVMTATGWSVGVGVWLALAAGSYGGMRTYLRGQRLSS